MFCCKVLLSWVILVTSVTFIRGNQIKVCQIITKQLGDNVNLSAYAPQLPNLAGKWWEMSRNVYGDDVKVTRDVTSLFIFLANNNRSVKRVIMAVEVGCSLTLQIKSYNHIKITLTLLQNGIIYGTKQKLSSDPAFDPMTVETKLAWPSGSALATDKNNNNDAVNVTCVYRLSEDDCESYKDSMTEFIHFNNKFGDIIASANSSKLDRYHHHHCQQRHQTKDKINCKVQKAKDGKKYRCECTVYVGIPNSITRTDVTDDSNDNIACLPFLVIVILLKMVVLAPGAF
ncbi:hypothetical protein HELRODRAFT_161959 [Helobdella robusta]|uniref:Uncharacterized protein n=1 Tax=Helobdella robusta TaxID=6412 RepID=T1ES32_HELRO|nr:hypothetical protein HELRODRAFT_161959 [Helobdella robusta]ESO02668.1 hypothetical protein HELRODRAFT_161959 [Helobdella robusta]